MTDKPIRFYDDDGTEINPDIIPDPSLCASCAKHDNGSEEPLCALNRWDQQGEDDFRCDAYVPKKGSEES